MSSNRKGLLAELKFQTLAIDKKLKVSVPVDTKERYDLIVDNGKDLYRVQVKSTAIEKKKHNTTAFEATLTGGDKMTKYKSNEVDFFCIYLETLDVWYVLPAEKVKDVKYISLFPNSEASKYDVYKDAWELFYNPDKYE